MPDIPDKIGAAPARPTHVASQRHDHNIVVLIIILFALVFGTTLLVQLSRVCWCGRRHQSQIGDTSDQVQLEQRQELAVPQKTKKTSVPHDHIAELP